MEGDPLETFRGYLRSLPEELLESVTGDYIWLSGFPPEPGGRATGFVQRRECCREECARRGVPQLYLRAESSIPPFAAEPVDSESRTH
jgi:hypothetical protein